EDADAAGVLTPEGLSEEHRMISQTAVEFVDNEVLPHLDQLEAKDWELACSAPTCPRRSEASSWTRPRRCWSARRPGGAHRSRRRSAHRPGWRLRRFS